jgi:predicted ATPase/class 3 adenylate cyclase
VAKTEGPRRARPLPTGTVTFLRTDIEGSMAMAHRLGPDWDAINAALLAIIRQAVDEHRGIVVRTEGDAVFAAFQEAGAAISAAASAQRALHAMGGDPEAVVPGEFPADVRVRMAVHTGEAHLAGDDYGGFDVNRVARLVAAAHGGQILVSEATQALVADRLPAGTTLDDLGTHQLRDLPRPERLAQLTIAGLPARFPPPRTAGRQSGNLPTRLTTFIGRDTELAAIAKLAERARLITLDGPGGIGKTSLAIEVGREIADRFADGAWLVPMADVAAPAEVAATIAHGIGLHDGPERPASAALLPYLADRSMLLILDNFEHLVDGAAQVSAIVQASPGSVVLVTSRAPLHVAGEHEIQVQPLTDEAVALFTDRARLIRPDWEPGTDRLVVEEICRLLDELPLGIELAAARIALLPPALIRDRLAARLPLPGPGVRDAPDRQRTLDGAVAWSHDLLPPGLQQLLAELGVFEDGFDAEEVERVVTPRDDGLDRLDDLLELADRSLIVAVPGAGRARFRLLRTIQSFALARLAASGQEAEVRRRHAEAYAALGAACHVHLNTSRHAEMLDRIGPEIANLRAADRWAIEAGEADLALRLVADQWRFWHGLGLMTEGRRLTEAALAMPSAASLGIQRARAAAAAGSLAYWQADTEAARHWYEEQLRLARASHDEAQIADALFNMGHVAFIDRDDEAVQQGYMDEVLARYRDLGDERAAARAAWSRGILALGAGRVEEAMPILERGLVEYERLDDPQYHAMTISTLAWAAFTVGDIAAAVRYYVEGLLETWRMRDLGTTTISLHVGVLMAVMLERFEDAAVLGGAWDGLCERYGVRPPMALSRFIDVNDPFGAARAALAADVHARAYERGRHMTLDAAVAMVVGMGADFDGIPMDGVGGSADAAPA